MLVLGLMSGTSADGIDVALARVEEGGDEWRVASGEKSLRAIPEAQRWNIQSRASERAHRLSRENGRIPHRSPKARRMGQHPQDLADEYRHKVKRELLGHVTLPMDAAVRKEVLRIAEGGNCTAGEISQLNFRVGEEFAAAATAGCKKFGVSLERVGLIGSHGQTIFHQGSPVTFLNAKIASTLQIGEPAVIAAQTGATTVGDFRVADMAAGGQGAPLVPYVDWLLLRDEKVGRVALNLGGIGNVTVLGRELTADRRQLTASDERNLRRALTNRAWGMRNEKANAETQRTQRGRREKRAYPSQQDAGATVMAFDTGPGNMVIDALVAHFTHGRERFDKEAQMARRGRCFASLLEELLKDPYLDIAPPKSTGREYYGREFVATLLEKARKYRMRPEDVVRTATVFTALTVVDALNRFVLPRVRIDELIVSGGGAKNPLIMAQMAVALKPIRVVPLSDLGIPEDAKEAYAFALLAYETFMGRTGNLPSATGAERAVVLGKICLA